MVSVTPYLWFDSNAQEAIDLYSGIFPDARVIDESRWPEGTPDAGGLLTATFEVAGQRFIALNGGPAFVFTEAISFLVSVETQEEVDHYWNALTANGGEESQCGWLKDRFGLSWQIVPTALVRYLADTDPVRAGRVMQAMLAMKRIVIADLEKAYEGN